MPIVAKVSSLLVLTSTASTLVKSLVLASATALAALSLDLISELPSDVGAHHLKQ